MIRPLLLAAPLVALLVPIGSLSACPWHGDMFGGEPGGYMMEPIAGGPTDLQQPASAQPALSREELMARQRELFLARYPQLAAGDGQKPTADASAPGAASVPSSGNF